MDQLEELMAKLQEQVQDAVKNNVVETIKDVETEHIREDVYNTYTPTMYQRRYEDNGLIDGENMKEVIKKEDNTISLDITNDTLGNPDPTVGYIDSIIESGEGYTWKNSEIYQEQPYPRPFTENTYKDLEENKQHVIALKEGLKQYNIE
jgi:hypothetical protein